MKPLFRTPRPLVLRIYLSTVLVLIGVGVAFYLSDHYLLRRRSRSELELRANSVTQHLAWSWNSPATFEQELKEISGDVRVRISIYTLAGELRGGSARPPMSPLEPNHLAKLSGAADGKTVSLCGDQRCPFAIPIRVNGSLVGYSIFHFRPPSPPPGLLPVALMITLAGAAIASFLLSRSLAVPLSKLAAAAHALGQGDLTARAGLRRKDELGLVSQAFDEMAERVSILLRSQTQLLADVSHELRTPLARIRVALDLVEDTDEAAAKESLLGITEDLTELERLVSDVLSAARLDLDTGKVGSSLPPLRYETLNADALLEKSVARFRANHPKRSIRLDAKSAVIEADPTLLRRVIDNLVDNAAKYSDEGTPLTVRSGLDGTSYSVEVEDRGIGIDASDLPLMFRPFFRSDRSRNRKTGGVGLGLLLARRIVEAHGGSIRVESLAGVGTTVKLSVPLRRPAA